MGGAGKAGGEPEVEPARQRPGGRGDVVDIWGIGGAADAEAGRVDAARVHRKGAERDRTAIAGDGDVAGDP